MRIPIKATAREPIKKAGYKSAKSAFPLDLTCVQQPVHTNLCIADDPSVDALSDNPTLPNPSWCGPPGRPTLSAHGGQPVEFFIRQTAESVTLSGTRDGLIERSDCSADFDSFGLISGVAFRMTSPRLTVVPMRRFILMVAVLVAGCPAYAQDPVSTDGTKYKVIFENARVRVLEYRDLPGDKTNQHAHPAFVLYAMAPFKRKIMLPNGKTIMREFNAGDILWSEMQTHVGENVGTTPTHVIMMELK